MGLPSRFGSYHSDIRRVVKRCSHHHWFVFNCRSLEPTSCDLFCGGHNGNIRDFCYALCSRVGAAFTYVCTRATWCSQPNQLSSRPCEHSAIHGSGNTTAAGHKAVYSFSLPCKLVPSWLSCSLFRPKPSIFLPLQVWLESSQFRCSCNLENLMQSPPLGRLTPGGQP